MSGPLTRTRDVSLALALLASASAAAAQPVHPGQEQGLGLTGPDIPPLLKDAQRDPYALPPQLDCPTLTDQVAALDQVLGPDLDAPQAKKGGVDPMAAVRAVLPYGGVVRFFTGAGRKEKALVNAALAGWERRGFLKAVAREMSCPGFAPIAPAPVQPAVAAPAVPPPSAPPQPVPGGTPSGGPAAPR